MHRKTVCVFRCTFPPNLGVIWQPFGPTWGLSGAFCALFVCVLLVMHPPSARSQAFFLLVIHPPWVGLQTHYSGTLGPLNCVFSCPSDDRGAVVRWPYLSAVEMISSYSGSITPLMCLAGPNDIRLIFFVCVCFT